MARTNTRRHRSAAPAAPAALAARLALPARRPDRGDPHARDRLAFVGSAATALVHDIKNSLSTVRSATAVLRRRLNDDPRARKLTHIVEAEIERLQGQVMDVLSLTRQGEDAGPIELIDLIGDLVRTTGIVAEEDGIAVRFHAGVASLPAFGRADQLRQVFFNLLLNARQAMPSGGRLNVVAREWRDDDGGPAGTEIVVEDTGAGLPGPDPSRVFEPFFTTKRVGTGIGLERVRRIVEAHGGHVAAENRPEGGARFIVRLPRLTRVCQLTGVGR